METLTQSQVPETHDLILHVPVELVLLAGGLQAPAALLHGLAQGPELLLHCPPSAWRVLKKLGINLTYEPAIPLLSIYPEKIII